MLVSIRVSSVTAVKQQDYRFLVADLVPHTVVSDTDAILVLVTFQFNAAMGTRILLQRYNPGNDPLPDTSWQTIQLFLNRSREDDLILHQFFLGCRATYSSMVRESPAS